MPPDGAAAAAAPGPVSAASIQEAARRRQLAVGRRRRNSIQHADLVKDRARARAKSRVQEEAGVVPAAPTAIDAAADKMETSFFAGQLAAFRLGAKVQMQTTLSHTAAVAPPRVAVKRPLVVAGTGTRAALYGGKSFTGELAAFKNITSDRMRETLSSTTELAAAADSRPRRLSMLAPLGAPLASQPVAAAEASAEASAEAAGAAASSEEFEVEGPERTLHPAAAGCRAQTVEELEELEQALQREEKQKLLATLAFLDDSQVATGGAEGGGDSVGVLQVVLVVVRGWWWWCRCSPCWCWCWCVD